MEESFALQTTALAARRDAAPIQPYRFVSDDWHTYVELAVINACAPAVPFILFQLFDWGASRIDVLRRVAIVHASVWTPVVALGLITIEAGVLKVFTAVWLEHIASNFNMAAYLYSLFSFLVLAIEESNLTNWLFFLGYLAYFQYMDLSE